MERERGWRKGRGRMIWDSEGGNEEGESDDLFM